MAISSIPKGKNRYQSLIIFITSFVLIIVSTLLINFYFSLQFSYDAVKIDLSGRQRMLTQQQAKSIGEMIQAESFNKGKGIDVAFKEVKDTFTLFDNTLIAFAKGGETKDAHGDPITLKPLKEGDALAALNRGAEIWSDYRLVVQELINSDISPLHTLAEASTYAKENSASLLESVDQLTTSLVQNKLPGHYVNLAGRQRMLSQRITKTLFELINAQNQLGDYAELFVTLKTDTETFNSTLDILRQGGIAEGGSTNLKALKNKDLIAKLDHAISLWKPLSNLLDKLLSADTKVFLAIAKANAHASNDNLALLKAMNDVTVALEKEQSKKSNFLGLIQLIGITLALGMFGFIMLFFMKHLKKADAELDKAVEETDEILSTINDGLFLINQDHIIGQQHSKSLPTVINVEEPAGKDFLTILGDIVPDKTIQVAKEYLELLYGDRVHADLVGDLNPLDQVEVYFEGDDFERKLGYLAFDFKRVTKDGNIPHLLVQVEDISQKVILERQLEETKGAAQEQFDMMLQVLHVQPKVLIQFLDETENSLNDINQILQEKSDQSNDEKIEGIARLMHRIKGDASGLQLHGFEQKAHEFEDLFVGLKTRSNLSGKDFLPVVIKLEEFLKQLSSLHLMIDKLTNLKEALSAEEGAELQIDSANDTKMSTILNILVNSVSSRQGKNVILNIFNEHLLPANYVKPIHDILTQLIRNSIVHGIEDTETRQRRNKTSEGVIAVKFFEDKINNTLSIKYLDNGQGLHTTTLLCTAIESGILSEREALSMSKKDIYSLIFKAGFSTKEDVETDAGRGVGMDVVNNIIEKYDGKITVDSIEKEVFKVEIVLPLEEQYSHSRNEIYALEEA